MRSHLAARMPVAFLGLLVVGALLVATGCQQAPAAQGQPAAGGGGAAATQPIVWKFQSSFPAASIAHKSIEELAKKVEAMSGGRLKWEVLPAGAVVPAFEVIDAVARGALDGGGTVPAYWVGKNPAASLFGTGPSFGMDANDLLAWEYYGGGWELYQEFLTQELKVDVIGFHFAPIPTQPFGWFKQPVTSASQLQGLKYRTVGLAAELFQEMGASVVSLPGGEIIPALEQGVIEAAEWNNPTDDKNLGFPDVAKNYMLQSYHQPVEYLEVLIARSKWNELPEDLKAIVRYGVMAESADWQWRTLDSNSRDLIDLVQNRGVQLHTTPPDILRAQLRAWDVIIERHSAQNPFFAKVIQSQKEWASRVVPYKVQIYVDNTYAYEHYWKR